MPLAEKMAREACRRTPPNVSEDDLKSVAYMGLVNAARKFDPSKGSFGVYAKIRICGDIKDYLKKIIAQSDIGNMLVQEAREETNELSTRDFFEFIATKLNDAEGDVVRMYYMEDKTLKEIGETRGVSESRISQILGSSIKRLQRVLKK
jgi:RNA polymerase sigma factor (sigma-70 family)